MLGSRRWRRARSRGSSRTRFRSRRLSWRRLRSNNFALYSHLIVRLIKLARTRRPVCVRRLSFKRTSEGRQRILGIPWEVTFIKDCIVADNLLLSHRIPENPALVVHRIPNEDALVVVWLEASPLVLLYMDIGQGAKNAKMRYIWLLSKPNFKGCLVFQGTCGTPVVHMDCSTKCIPPKRRR